MNKEQCRQREWNIMRETNISKKNEWALIHSNQVMENSQITNVCNDGEDNDLEPLGKYHLSLTHKIHNEICIRKGRSLKAHIQTFISNWLNEASLNDQYLHLMENNTVYIHKYMHLFLILFFFLFFVLCFFFIFFVVAIVVVIYFLFFLRIL